MSDKPIQVHIDAAAQHPSIPDRQGDGICPDCRVPEEIGFGLAGGGFGAYGYCPQCYRVLWKCQSEA